MHNFDFLCHELGLNLSVEYINWAANQIEGNTTDGSFFGPLVRGLEQEGICEESYMPYGASYSPGAPPIPTSDAMNDAAVRKNYYIAWVKHWNVNTGMSQDQLDAMKDLLDRGHPVAVGSRWLYSPVFSLDHVLQVPAAHEVFDGHSVVVVGYDDDSGYPGGGFFIIRNSKGPLWEDSGHAKIPYEYYALYGNDAVALDVRSSTMGLHLPPALPFIQKNNVIEFEDLTISQSSPTASIQNMEGFTSGVWSENQQVFLPATAAEDYVEFYLFYLKDTVKDMNVFFTKAPDFGIVDFSVNGNVVLENYDTYSQVVQPAERVKLGKVALINGINTFRVRVKGKSSSSSGYKTGVDFLELLTPSPTTSNLTGVYLLLL